ncbi:hypothetical protein PHJA_001762100 [Phtheirospermum japonicum]|uniref:Uncharacterized protein n=1 Tax=Phtheirospermum japonicum TaxID=374723 RepID=A0A830C9C4_9LAMI|nr:hypothetical protein PHJA_001762100 [Phtheirospermum japonicum]
MGDLPMDKIQISGAALASLLDRSSAATGDIHGYLFGHATVSTLNTLSDHPTTTAAASLLVATITSFLSVPSHLPLPFPPPLPPLIPPTSSAGSPPAGKPLSGPP